MSESLPSAFADACQRLQAKGPIAFIKAVDSSTAEMETHHVGSLDEDPLAVAFVRIFVPSGPDWWLEWHQRPQPIVKFPSDTRFAVLGGTAEVCIYQEERYPVITQRAGDAAPLPNSGRQTIASRSLATYGDDFAVTELTSNTFYSLKCCSEALLLIVSRSSSPGGHFTEATYLWHDDDGCRHRGVPKPPVRSPATVHRKLRSSLFERLKDFCGCQPDVESARLAHLSAFVGAVTLLRGDIRARDPPTLRETDKATCKRIGDSLLEYVGYGGEIDDVARALNPRRGAEVKLEKTITLRSSIASRAHSNIYRDESDEAMNTRSCGDGRVEPAEEESATVVINRFVLFDDETTLGIKLHLFSSPAETFRHNHSTNVISACLKGSYQHRVFSFEALKDGDTPTPLHIRGDEGKIQPSRKTLNKKLIQRTEYTFRSGNVYFLNKEGFHTIQAPAADTDDKLATSSVVTLFFKDRYKPRGTYAEFAEVPDCQTSEEVAASPERSRQLKKIVHERLRRDGRPPTLLEREKAAAWQQLQSNFLSNVPAPGTKNWLAKVATWERQFNQGQQEVIRDVMTSLTDAGVDSSAINIVSAGIDETIEFIVSSKPVSWSIEETFPRTRKWIDDVHTTVTFDLQAQKVSVTFDSSGSRCPHPTVMALQRLSNDAALLLTKLRGLRREATCGLPLPTSLLIWAAAAPWLTVGNASPNGVGALRAALEALSRVEPQAEVQCAEPADCGVTREWARLVLTRVFVA